MAELKLIYFAGCPNAAAARAILQESGMPFEEVRQDDLPENDPLRGYTSPTILLGDRVVYGTASGDAGCSLAPPDAANILDQIGAVA